MLPFYDSPCLQIGVDEVGRGPMFGRVYVSAVCFNSPRGTLDTWMAEIKDSKKFGKSKKALKRMNELAELIKEHSVWAIEYMDECDIDTYNILHATQLAMHKAIQNVLNKLKTANNLLILIDGNYYTDLLFVHNKEFVSVPAVTVIEGDSTYINIAAASILAKVERDKYINEMCDKYPMLDDLYGLRNNKGYGCKTHMDAINIHGISPWHRKSFGACKTAKICIEFTNNIW